MEKDNVGVLDGIPNEVEEMDVGERELFKHLVAIK
jgi:hypothetical protein